MTLGNADITLGILGGGQLGRMSAIAAARLGISVIIYAPEENCPASYVAKETITADYNDKNALKEFSEKTDIISYEFENIPVKTIDCLGLLKQDSVLPKKTLLDVSQDRIKEKTFLNELDIETARWAAVLDINDVQSVCDLWKSEHFILKTTRFGYDGKGQIKCQSDKVSDNAEIHSFLTTGTSSDIIMEDFITFTDEISVIAARDKEGKTAFYGPMLNEHKNHILHKTTVPSGVSETIKNKAYEVAEKIANAIDLVGVLTVEFFVCDDERLLVNEIAPRTHNSGHWTIDACAVSQFENHIRTVCGLPVGSTERHSDAVMLNLIGDDVKTIDKYMQDNNACIHLYGKKEIKNGRKMGHVTFLTPKTDKD